MSVPAVSVLTALDPHQVAALEWSPCEGWRGVEQKVLSRGHGVVVGMLRLTPGAGEPPHTHTLGEHHVWVLEGTVRVGDTDLPTGSYLHVRPGTLHQLEDVGSGSTLLFCYVEPAA